MDYDVSSMYPYVLGEMNPRSKEFWRTLDEEHRMRYLNRKYWPHQVQVDREKNWGDAERWCYENFSSRGWRNVGTYFAFKSGTEATAFSLKWL